MIKFLRNPVFLLTSTIFLLILLILGLLMIYYQQNLTRTIDINYKIKNEVNEIASATVDPQKLDVLLRRTNFASEYKKRTGNDMETIEFVITKIPQAVGVFEGKENIQSWGSSYDGSSKTLKVYIYLYKEGVIDNNTQSIISKYYSNAAFQELMTVIRDPSVIYENEGFWKTTDMSEEELLKYIYFLNVEKK